MPHRQHHLDDATDTGCCRRVTDVRLDRPEPQRQVIRPALLSVGGEQGLRLDRVTQPGSRAVRLHGVDLGC